MDRSELIAKLKTFKKNIRRKYKINKFTLFGSSAKGKLRRDVDIALLVNEKEMKDGIYQLDLIKLMKRSDIVVVMSNDAPFLLKQGNKE